MADGGWRWSDGNHYIAGLELRAYATRPREARLDTGWKRITRATRGAAQAGCELPAKKAALVASAAMQRVLDLLFDAGGFTRTLAQVVQLRATHVATALDRDRADRRTIGLEHAFHAFAVRDLANGER